MKNLRINQEDITNFIAEKIFKDINHAYDWMELEIQGGTQICFFDTHLTSNNFPTKVFSDVQSFQEWRKPLNIHREELLLRIKNLQSGISKEQ